MKVFITGVEGYIGSLLAPLLMQHGHEVVGTDTGYYRDGWLYSDSKTGSCFPRFINRDLRNLTEDDLSGFDAVIHLAELSNDPLGENNPALTHVINHQGSVNLAKNAKRAGVSRFIYTSSCSVYGLGSGDFLTEESPVNPQTAYAVCKTLVEKDVGQLADDSFSPVFLRNSTAYGASPRMRFDIVLNNLSGLAWTSKKIAMTSDGTPWRPLVHVMDICTAIRCSLEAPSNSIHNQIFNVGTTPPIIAYARSLKLLLQNFLAVSFPWGQALATIVAIESISTRSINNCPASAALGTPRKAPRNFARYSRASPWIKVDSISVLLHG